MSAASCTISAWPSTTTGSSASSVVMVQRPSSARFRALREPSALLAQRAPSLQTAHTGITCGRPSRQMVASQ